MALLHKLMRMHDLPRGSQQQRPCVVCNVFSRHFWRVAHLNAQLCGCLQVDTVRTYANHRNHLQRWPLLHLRTGDH